MGLTNCTINSTSLTKVGGQAVDNNADIDANLVITPVAYHSVKASSFSVAGSLPSAISAVTFTDTGTPGTFANTVSVNIDLNDSYTMPSADTTVTLDINGAADKGETNQTTVSGSNVHISDSSVTVTTSHSSQADNYSQSGVPSSTAVTLFTKVFSAGTNKKFANDPATCYTIDSPTLSRYVVEVTENTGTFAGDNLTQFTLTVKYKFPNVDSTSNKITYIARVKDNITVSDDKIYKAIVPSSQINYFGESRNVTIVGDSGAKLKIDAYVTSTPAVSLLGSEYNNTGKEITVGSNNQVIETITFPENTTNAAIYYTVKLTEVSPYDFVFNSGNSPKTYALTQYAQSSITFSVSRNSTTGMTIPTNTYSQTGFPLLDPFEYDDEYLPLPVSWVINSSGASWKPAQTPIQINEITGSSSISGSTDVNIANSGVIGGTLSAVVNNTSNPKKVTVSGIYSVRRFPSIPTNAILNLSKIIELNTAPVANTPSNQAIANNTATTFTLTGSDADGDTLTFSIVSQGSKGTAVINSSTGACTYTPSSALVSGGDTFTFKVNDGIDDSNTASVPVTIASSGSNAPTFNSVWSWDNTEVEMTPGLIGAAAFQGTAAYTSNSVGATSFNAIFTSWSLDSTHTGFPSYVDNFGDMTIRYTFKYGSTTLASDVVNINQGTSQFDQSARTGTINVTSSTVTVPNSHNSGNGLIASGSYTFEWKIEYDNVLQ